MNIIKTIILHRNLRIKQEILCNKVVEWSQIRNKPQSSEIPFLNEFSSINDAVKEIEKKIPNIYFFLSDMLGGASSIKKEALSKTDDSRKIK
jgi:hypothetical protein